MSEPVERHFHAMGGEAHVIVVGGPRSLAVEAQHRIADLERRWSRLDEQSEVATVNRDAGLPVVVSPDTMELVERAVHARRITRGRFDPTVLGAPPRDTGEIEIVANTVRLPAGTGFDPGGIAAALAADIVADELRAEGAAGVYVRLGDDVHVDGEAPSGRGWTIALDHPRFRSPLATIRLTRGAVATYTRDAAFATVVARHAWMAAALARAVVSGSPRRFDLLATNGAAALMMDADGRCSASLGIDTYLASPLHPSIARERVAPRDLVRAS